MGENSKADQRPQQMTSRQHHATSHLPRLCEQHHHHHHHHISLVSVSNTIIITIITSPSSLTIIITSPWSQCASSSHPAAQEREINASAAAAARCDANDLKAAAGHVSAQDDDREGQDSNCNYNYVPSSHCDANSNNHNIYVGLANYHNVKANINKEKHMAHCTYVERPHDNFIQISDRDSADPQRSPPPPRTGGSPSTAVLLDGGEGGDRSGVFPSPTRAAARESSAPRRDPEALRRARDACAEHRQLREESRARMRAHLIMYRRLMLLRLIRALRLKTLEQQSRLQCCYDVILDTRKEVLKAGVIDQCQASV
ncbi:unnamed protein product [Lampetra fluviatilis]